MNSKRRDYSFECADPAKSIFTIDPFVFESMKGKENSIVIDVREYGELPEVTEFEHVKIPMSRFKSEMDKIQEKTVIIFCQVGQRSLIAARALAAHFGESKKVYSLGGGILHWKKSLEHAGKEA